MRAGGGKQKGSVFEREICKKLSFWITHGEMEDCLWRSAISGGRATVAHRKGRVVRQGGDICAVSPEGLRLTDVWYIECKHVKKLQLDQFLIKGTGLLATFWEKCVKEAGRHNKHPIIIAKQNGWPILILSWSTLPEMPIPQVECGACAIWRFDDLVERPFGDTT